MDSVKPLRFDDAWSVANEFVRQRLTACAAQVVLVRDLYGRARVVLDDRARQEARRWKSTELIEQVRHRLSDEGLLPKHLDEGAAGLRRDLLALGVFSEMPDGRVNMPDVYRVGFGLGRRGGVKPIR